MKLFNNSYYSLNSHHEKPTCLEKAVVRLDSYFYWGEITTDVLARDDLSKELYCVRRPGRALSTKEKILKIISWIFFPVVLIVLALRYILHKILNLNYKTIFIQNTIASESYPPNVIKSQKIVREIYFDQAKENATEANRILKDKGIRILDIYPENNHIVFTFSIENYPTVSFTFVASKFNEVNGTSKVLDNILVEAMVRRTHARNLLAAHKIQKFEVPKVIGLNLKSGLLVSKLDLERTNLQPLTEDFLRNPTRLENSEDPFTNINSKRRLAIINDCIDKYLYFAIKSGRSGIVPGQKKMVLNVNSETTSNYSCVVQSIGFFHNQSFDEKQKQQAASIRKILKAVPPSFLKGLIMKLPRSLRKDWKFMWSLISPQLSHTLNLSASIHIKGKHHLLYEQKLELVQEYLAFLAKRKITQDPKTGRHCTVVQKFGGITIDAKTIAGELFHNADTSEPEYNKPCLGESILNQLITFGIIRGYENQKREVWIYLD
ncbi:Family of unknown function (DUF648) [Chlamydia serpentis]|uniref:Uncharacterized protein n=1 Tax=Chlamydia serpentis TaxID=1967782 RepID=A0A2R8FAQ5_9CHLA|nr:DUF648 domain-containing protein [Chlamydia serpentis]SPN73337.1 Family of unknown function (DUF648) [Chlamydia serpentis]